MSTVVKRRLVKLVVNFLFYFRTDEAEVGRQGGGPRAAVGGLGSRGGPPIRPVCLPAHRSPAAGALQNHP